MYIKNAPNQCLGFSLVDSSGVAVTGATVTARRCIDGGSQVTATGSVSDKGNGQYCFNMDTADTNGDCITYLFTATSAVPVEKTICTSRPAVGRPSVGIHFTDPRFFLKTLADGGRLHNVSEASLYSSSSLAAFFTEQAARGVVDDTNWTANTYKTLLSISSGMGLVSNIIGPTGISGTPTTTFEITVDGVLTEIAMTHPSNFVRAVLGPLMASLSSTGEYYTSGFVGMKNYGGITSNKDKLTCAVDTHGVVPPWGHIGLFGTPCLYFSKSLLIRAKTTQNNSSTGYQERQAAIQYYNFIST